MSHQKHTAAEIEAFEQIAPKYQINIERVSDQAVARGLGPFKYANTAQLFNIFLDGMRAERDLVRLFYVRAEDAVGNDLSALVEARHSEDADKLWREHFEIGEDDMSPIWIGYVPFLGQVGMIPWESINNSVKKIREPSVGANLYFVRCEGSEFGSPFNYDGFFEATHIDEATALWRKAYGKEEHVKPDWIGPVPISGKPGVIPWAQLGGVPDQPEQAPADAPR